MSTKRPTSDVSLQTKSCAFLARVVQFTFLYKPEGDTLLDYLTDKVDRPISSAIYFLLPSGSKSFLHRLPCAETFHFYMGEPHTVFELHDNGQIKLTVLGQDLEAGHKLQYTVPPNVWFCSFPTLDIESFSADGSVLVKAPYRDPELYYSLVGVTCAPAFQFEDSETATFDEMIAIAPKANSFLKYLVRH